MSGHIELYNDKYLLSNKSFGLEDAQFVNLLGKA